MSDEEEPIAETTTEVREPGTEVVTAKVTFHDREITVTAPTPDQLAILYRLQATFTKASKQENMEASRAVKLLARALSVVLSIIPDDDDQDFVEDLILMGDATLEETLPIVTTAIEKLKKANPSNREDRRAAEKAARKSSLVVE